MTRTDDPGREEPRAPVQLTGPGAPGDGSAPPPAQAVADAVHALNNPLFAILGLLEFLLQDAEPGTRTRHRLELVRASALEMRDVARALLEQSRTWTEGSS